MISKRISLARQHIAIHIAGVREIIIEYLHGFEGECVLELKGHSQCVAVVTALNTTQVASGSCDSNVCVWDCETGKCLHTLRGHTGAITALAVCKRGILASASRDGTVRLWNPVSGKSRGTLHEQMFAVSVVAATLDGNLATHDDDSILIYDVLKGTRLQEIACHVEEPVHSLICLRNGGFLACSEDGEQAWRSSQKLFDDYGQFITAVVVISETKIAVATASGEVFVFNNRQRVVECRAPCGSGIRALAYFDGLLVATCLDQELHVWVEEDGTNIQNITEVGSLYLAVMPNKVLVTSNGNDLQVWM